MLNEELFKGQLYSSILNTDFFSMGPIKYKPVHFCGTPLPKGRSHPSPERRCPFLGIYQKVPTG